MPYWLHSATIFGAYECPKCKNKGEIKEEGMEFVGETFGLGGFQCPHCGKDLQVDEDDEEYEEEEEEEIDEDDEDF